MRGLILTITVILAAALYNVFLSPHQEDTVTHHVGEVVSVDNERVTVVGTGRLGDQKLVIQLADQQIQLSNLLTGALEYDEFYVEGDQVVLAEQNGHYHVLALFRLPVLITLTLVFAIGLLLYARRVGFYALLSFAGSLMIIFGLLIPGLLAGFSPIFITSLTVFSLSTLIILSVAGMDNQRQGGVDWHNHWTGADHATLHVGGASVAFGRDDTTIGAAASV